LDATLAGNVVFLTGATRGIGRATAVRLAGLGARLALAGRSAGALDDAASECRARGAPRVFTRSFDLASEAAILDFYAAASRDLGAPGVLINNAGLNPGKRALVDVTTEELDLAIAVNLRAPFILAREAARDMRERGGGHIVNVLSTVCHFANETMGAYTAAKAGLDALTAVLRKELRPFGIKVSSVYPGGTNTTFRAQVRADYMRPESVAEAIVAVLTLPSDVAVHELTFRPMVETNF
jgi:NAD(P)-dependent dehydrogenase (short-subunit alcohol dehydrogenase family)